jgi:elongation factor G
VTYQPTDIRNLVFLGHNGVGKTSVADAVLFTAGVTTRLGRVDEGTSTLDHAPDEVERKITINLGLAGFEWHKTKVNILDSPGYPDFYGDVVAAVSVADCGLVVVRADGGVEVGTEKIWGFLSDRERPAFVVVNRMDREHANYAAAVESSAEKLRCRTVPLFIPMGEGEAFEGVIDVLERKAYRYQKDGSGNFAQEEVPAGDKDRVEEAHGALVEAAAEVDDSLLERYLEGESLADDEVAKALVEGVATRKVVPAIPVSGATNVGCAHLLDMIVRLAPSPAAAGAVKAADGTAREPRTEAPLSALVFKTMSEPHMGDLSILRVYSGVLKPGTEVLNSSLDSAEKVGQIYHLAGKERKETQEIVPGDLGAAVKLRGTHTGNTLCDKGNPIVLPAPDFPHPNISVAIEPKSKGDEDKIGSGLARLQEEDPTFKMQVDPEIHQTIVSGLGELHLDVVIARLRRRFGVDVELTRPRIPYRETIRGKAEVQGKYKKQTGGRGQYGDVWLRLEPRASGEGFEFKSAVVGGAVPSKYFPAVEKGVREVMEQGVYAGYPIVDLTATIYDGSYHDVDSSDMAFKVAGSMAFKKAFMEARPVLLEPIYEIMVTVPEENLGDVMGDLSSRRGKIHGVEAHGGTQVVKAHVPLAELWKYSTNLRSLTQGRGMHEWTLSHYEEVPKEISEKIRAEAEQAKEEK